jgi:hypothetical protein
MSTSNKMYLGRHVKCLTFWPDFNQIWIYLTDIRSVEVILTHADIRTDRLAANNIQLEHRAFMAS